MAKVILIGADVALCEGLAQSLIGFGHDVLFAATVAEVAGTLNEDQPVIAVVSCDALAAGDVGMSLPFTPGGALIVYQKSHAEKPFLPPQLQRSTLANLVLPLERHRLLALVQSFDNRTRSRGRVLRDDFGEDFQPEF